MERKSFETAFGNAVSALLSRVHTAFPGVLQSFDRQLRTAEIKPNILDDSGEEYPVIPDVPILFMGNGEFTLDFDLVFGTHVICICSERALDAWKLSGTTGAPGETRRHALTDCIAIPGLTPLPAIPLLPIEAGSVALRNSANTVALKMTSSGIEITGDIKITGNIELQPNLLNPLVPFDVSLYPVISGVPIPVPVGLGSHTHISAAPGSPTLGPAPA